MGHELIEHQLLADQIAGHGRLPPGHTEQPGKGREGRTGHCLEV
jgi:hypothetical protein